MGKIDTSNSYTGRIIISDTAFVPVVGLMEAATTRGLRSILLL